jgi:hypothetical protein
VTSDCYAILGVSPAAEDVVIGAAYRALMRHYHPDTNPDPTAQARAREITAAYAVLRDPVSRADYDARRKAADEFWDSDDPPRQPPPMRSAAIASAALAAILVGAVWMSQGNQPAKVSTASPAKQAPAKAEPAPAEPPKALEPEAQRLARLAPPVSPPDAELEAALAPVPVTSAAVIPDEKPPATPKEPKVALARLPKTPSKPVTKPAQTASDLQNDRVATLNRVSSGFFTQSMVHADQSKKTLLMAARDRSEAERKACRSDSCVASAYLRQIRATSAIMEGKTGPK